MNPAPEPHARLASVASALPEGTLSAAAAVDVLCRLFQDEEPSFIEKIVQHSGVESRHVVPSIADVLRPSTFGERNRRYREAALALAETASRRALARAHLRAEEVDLFIDVSCTGIAIPALDVELARRLGLRSDARRIPITESGCAAGALALGLASTHAEVGAIALVVAVEICSLTLQQQDRSRTNLIASVLFGDGAAAAVVRPDGDGPRFLATRSLLVPDSQDAMGFEVSERGLAIRLKRELPEVLASHLPRAIDGFLSAHGSSRERVGLHLVHPGGRRILDAYAARFGLGPEALRFSRESLRRFGNLSSASILSVLELALDGGAREPTQALMVGVGPGLSLELTLLDWQGAGERSGPEARADGLIGP